MAKTFITEFDVSEYEVGHFNVDASELGWPPGFVPRELTTSMGNKLPLELIRADGSAFVYQQLSGCIQLTVYND